MARNYFRGKYTPKNPGKYVGDVSNIIYRSSYELKAFVFCDTNPNILRWMSEETVIPYLSPVDGKSHRYFVDLTMMYKTKSGEIKRAIAEIKPYKQTIEPKKPQRVTKQYVESVQTYMVNQAKWAAATAWATKKGYEFMLLTESELGIS